MTRSTRDSRRDALSTDPTKGPVQRAEELRKRFPQLFDFREDFTSAVSRYRSASVKCGEVWRALPLDATVSLRHAQEGWQCLGAIRDGQWVPEERPVGPLANKLIFDEGPPPTLDAHHLRPGIALTTPLSGSATGRDERSTVSLGYYGRAVFVPSQSEQINVHGQLLTYRPGSIQDQSSFQFWQSWGIDARIGVELLSRSAHHGHIRFYAPKRPREELTLGEDLHAAAKRLLAEVLGARPATRSWGPRNGYLNRRPERGEVVQITFNPAIGPVPCVVVSPQEFNEQTLDVILALRCVPYSPSHKNNALLIPIGASGCLAGVDGQWSISVAGVRGITRASNRVKSYSPSIQLPNDVFDDLQERLEYFYA